MPIARPAVRVTLALFALFALVSASRSAHVAACVPAPSPPPGATQPLPTATLTVNAAAAQAEIIFRGHPIRHEDVSYKLIDAPATRTTFAIETLWKGAATAEVTILTYSCGGDANPFTTSGTYIVYASKGLNGELVPIAGISRHAGANDSEDHVLGPGAVPGATAIASAIAVIPSPVPITTAAPLPTPVIAPRASAPAVSASGHRSRAPVLFAGGAILVSGSLLTALLLRRRLQRQ